ncbi:MAG: restriction endonuclease subunit S [Candidatus Scalindua sp.]|nr:restriction endonuclease subunit S [Candidatus Scalindua sp.]
MGEWKECKLKTLGRVVTGKTPSRNNPEDWGIVMPFVTPSDYKKYRKKAYFSERNLSKEGVQRLKNKVLPPKSVLVTCIGSDMGKVVMNEIEVITNQQINSVIPHKEVDNNFLYYSLVYMYDILRVYGGDGTAVPIINKGDFENIETLLPPLPEQKAIASVLACLDDKIDLLHRQNKTLEAMAETLFRQWFVEEAKEDWEEDSLLRLVQLVGGGTPKTSILDYWDGNIPWLAGGDIASNHKSFVLNTEKRITENGLNNSSAKLLPKYATVISARGTVGKYSLLAQPMAFSQSNYGILPRIDNCFFFTYLLINYVVEELQSSAYGSVFDTITTTTFKENKVPVPTESEIRSFEDLVSLYFHKIFQNKIQIGNLEKLRDVLLPKLMSGEVRLKI